MISWCSVEVTRDNAYLSQKKRLWRKSLHYNVGLCAGFVMYIRAYIVDLRGKIVDLSKFIPFYFGVNDIFITFANELL